MNGMLFSLAFAALYAAHMLADHWIQTQHQAVTKARPGRAGRVSCATHVTTYTLTAALVLAAVAWRTGAPLNPGRCALALLVSAASHYFADRRTGLERLARAVGKQGLFDLGAPRPGRDDNPSLGTGAYALDQSFHIAFLFVSALIIA
ncbi:MAG TPA: DUF3307 domain-containing protein [Actinocrinis sp.]|nr:DUF3307 domain-containing protein [Actinocrinis sp.]